MSDNTLLNIRNLKVSFKNDDGFLQILRGVDVQLKKGDILGILGESGSGKTVTASSILRLVNDGSFRIDSGSIQFKGVEITKLKEKDMRAIRGKQISYIFQDASAALNPYKTIGKQLKEVLKVHGESFTKEKIINGMKRVGIENAEVIYNMYKSQLSGGLCQRVVIAMATICSPEIIIADEPTTAIDASLQKKVLDLLRDINLNNNSSIIVITHDFDVVKYICNKVMVMYGGLVMEEGTVEEVLNNPRHPYTRELLRCVESLNANEECLYSLQGKAPSPQEFKDQCPFYDRCKYKRDECTTAIPEITTIESRRIRCVLEKGGDTLDGR
jgi:peptide/nickel transport system ATP-binding protein